MMIAVECDSISSVQAPSFFTTASTFAGSPVRNSHSGCTASNLRANFARSCGRSCCGSMLMDTKRTSLPNSSPSSFFACTSFAVISGQASPHWVNTKLISTTLSFMPSL